MSASPAQSPVLLPRPTPQCPPRVTARTASKSAFSVPRHQLPPIIPERKSYSSARSIHSVSDTSSVMSMPLMTPPDASHYQNHTQYPLPTIYQSQSQPHLPASDHRYPVSIHQRTSSMAYHAQTMPRHSEDDSPFAYSVDGANVSRPAMNALRSSAKTRSLTHSLPNVLTCYQSALPGLLFRLYAHFVLEQRSLPPFACQRAATAVCWPPRCPTWSLAWLSSRPIAQEKLAPPSATAGATRKISR